MINQIGKDNDSIFNAYGNHLYKINHKENEFKYNKIGEKISSQRNDFAPKYIGMAIYKEIKVDVGKILRQLCQQKGIEIIEA